jgi:hypothetical protein
MPRTHRPGITSFQMPNPSLSVRLVLAMVALVFGLAAPGASADAVARSVVLPTTYDAAPYAAWDSSPRPSTHQSSGLVGNPLVAFPGGVAAEGGERLLWTSWQNYPKVTQAGRDYAQIGDRLYTRHAVDRLQPSGLGAPAGATGAGRSISPNFVEDVLTSTRGVPVKGPAGEARMSFTSGTVQVITEDNIVITVITR